MDDVLDLSELERRLFPKPADTWTPDDWFAFFACAQQLADKYGKDQILAMVDEFVAGTVNLSNPRAIFAGSPPRFTRSRVTYAAYVVSRTSTRPQVDSAPGAPTMPSSPISPCPSCPPHAARGHGGAVYSSSVTDAQWATLNRCCLRRAARRAAADDPRRIAAV